ncbi:MAG TPA: stage II sporulation protein M [Nitrososphaerales archaeon]
MEYQTPEKPKVFTRSWLKVFVIVLVSLLGVAFIGSATPMDKSQAEQMLEEAKKVLPQKPSTDAIFLNNFRASLLMTIPGIGIVLAGIILYNTGAVFGATGVIINIYGPLLMLVVAITPFFWFEFLAYAAGVTQSLYLTQGILKKNFKREIKRTVFVIALIALFLLLGAAVEVLFIQQA